MLLVLAMDELRVVELPKVASNESECVIDSDGFSCVFILFCASSHFVLIVCIMSEVDLRCEASDVGILVQPFGAWSKSSNRTVIAFPVRASAVSGLFW